LIPYDQGLLGHSDADALLHALIDALLGAAGLGDIGQHFSDQDAQFHDADSAALLRQIDQKLRQADWRIGNVDATIIAQAPRLAGHLPAMQARIAELLELEVTQVNVKAKTAERIGPIGRGEAIEVQAVALIYR
jgi:2-C-methyl-D-erythritol 2,4-cyclodiphosphate synthase